MNTGRIRNWVVVAGFAMLGIPAMAQSVASLEATHAKAAAANTAAKHAAVAKEYRLHAEALNAKAAEHEKNAAAMVRQMPQVQKWPGLASGQLQKEKSQAVETRRAAREAMTLADHHMRLAVEAQAEGPVVAGD